MLTISFATGVSSSVDLGEDRLSEDLGDAREEGHDVIGQ
jgi:hypothetical protein